jgi:hypothetical protein
MYTIAQVLYHRERKVFSICTNGAELTFFLQSGKMPEDQRLAVINSLHKPHRQPCADGKWPRPSLDDCRLCT